MTEPAKRGTVHSWRRKALAFLRANGGNVAMMFGLSLVPITIAAGAGLDFARAMMVRSAMSDALDAATLAVGATPGLTAAQATTLAQQYINANYTEDTTQYGAPAVSSVTIDPTAQTVHIVVTDAMPTTLLSVGNVMPVLNLTVSSTVTWGQSRLWVALVLDNTGSMSQTDSTYPYTSKISALKTAAHNLITTLQNASTNVGDVQMTITPFAKLVNIGKSYVNDASIDWTDWEAPPVDQHGNPDPPPFSTGPGSSCPYSTSSDGFGCVRQPGSTSSVSTVPSTGTYAGYICPGVMQAHNAATGTGGHYFNGCYDSVTATQSSTSTSTSNGSGSNQICSDTGKNSGTSCTCSGAPARNSTNSSTSGNTTTVYTYGSCGCSNNGKSGKNLVTTCTQPYTTVATTTTTTTTSGYSHTWRPDNHSVWNGCIEDRTQDYDTQNTTPSAAGTLFPAANDDNCPVSTVTSLPSTWTAAQWTALGNQIDAMTPNGSTNQTIGLVHGWQTLTSGTGPYNAPALPSNTSKVMILVSDGLNTQDRWYGDGSNQSGPATVAASVDARMALACTNAKAAGITIYTIFVDLGGTQGNSSVLQNCATDSSYYFDLQTAGAIVTTFNTIAQRITNLRVSQ